MASDLSSAIFDWLTDDADAASYRALVMSIKEAGFIDADLLNDNHTARRASGSSQILAASVQDAGDFPIAVGNERATVVIRHYDRGYGYKNLRVVRDCLIASLRDFTSVLTAVAGQPRKGVLRLEYAGRTGHRRDMVFNCDWEAVTFIGTLIVEDF
jgi:hypothetical protein